MRKHSFQYGDIIGEQNSIFIEEIKPRIKGKKTKRRQAKIKCGICNKVYITDLRLDKKHWCCPDCSKQLLAQKRQKKFYKEGQILNKETGSTLIKLTYRDNKSNQHGIVKCGVCGQEYETKLSIVEKGSLCKTCHMNKIHNKAKKYNPGDIIKSINDLLFLFKEETKPQISISRTTRCGIFIRLDENYNQIGEPFYSQLGHIVSGHCTGNPRSNGEIAFANALDELGYSYQQEYSFDDLFSSKNKMLRFDFMIPIFNNKKILIELDGKQHYMPIEFFGGEEAFKTNQQRDKLKNDYVYSHTDLYLIRIPYWDYKKINTYFVEELITNKIKEIEQEG